MNSQVLVERLFETIITGDRNASREVVAQAAQQLGDPKALLTEVFWPTYQLMDKLHRADQLARMNHHMGMRLLRVLVDQAASKLSCDGSQKRTIFAFCGQSEGEELGAQIACDLLEASGFTVSFAGAGIPNDEVLARVNEDKPNVLLMFCSAASDLPEIRSLIDTIKEIGAASTTQIAVGGGVFNRAEGLAEEIGADIWATGPLELVEALIAEPSKRSAARTSVVRTAKRRKAA